MMPVLEELERDFLVFRQLCVQVRLSGARGIESGNKDAHAVGPAGSGIPAEPVPASIAIGVFDGLHTGHRKLLDQLVQDARERGISAVAVTFDPDPDMVLSPHPVRHLMTTEDRLRALAASGVDEVVVVPFTRELASLGHEEFFDDVLGTHLAISSIHVGSDFRLGAGGASTVEVIDAWGRGRGIDVFGHDLVLDDGKPVSATRIRASLATSDVCRARHELGRRYMVRGRVSSGRGQGTGMGFPTANIVCDPAAQMPADGVYSGLVLVDGRVWPAAVNVGVPPTFKDEPGASRLEANLIGFTGDLYGKDVSLAFGTFLRPSRVFDSNEELIRTVLGNIDQVRREFGESGVRVSHDQ